MLQLKVSWRSWIGFFVPGFCVHLTFFHSGSEDKGLGVWIKQLLYLLLLLVLMGQVRSPVQALSCSSKQQFAQLILEISAILCYFVRHFLRQLGADVKAKMGAGHALVLLDVFTVIVKFFHCRARKVLVFQQSVIVSLFVADRLLKNHSKKVIFTGISL